MAVKSNDVNEIKDTTTPPLNTPPAHPLPGVHFDFYFYLTLLALVGVVLNVYKIRWCFAIWAVTNFLFSIKNFRSWMLYRDRYFLWQGSLFGVYWCLAIWGLVAWK